MLTLRPGTHDDIDAVLGLWADAGAVASVGSNAGGLARLLAHDRGALIVADDGSGRVVGSVIAGYDGWRGSIYRLAVHPQWRRQGLAGQLLAAADDRLRRLGCERVAAIVLRDREDAMAFWSASTYDHQPATTRFTRRL